MKQLTFVARDLDETDRFGAILARTLPDGVTVALSGTLGAGKTRLVQAIAENCGIEPGTVVSPTFVLCQEYHGDRVLYHFDAYRLKDEDEFEQLGPQEYFDSPGLVCIEWAERIRGSLPEERIEISIDVTGDTERTIEVTSIGDRYDGVVDAIAERIDAGRAGAL